jgi:hypothetical protein
MRGNPLCVDTARFLSFTHHSIHKRFRKGPRPFFCSSAQQASWLVAVFFSSVESGPPLPPPPETNLSTFQSPPDASVCVCVCVCVCVLFSCLCVPLLSALLMSFRWPLPGQAFTIGLRVLQRLCASVQGCSQKSHFGSLAQYGFFKFS